MIRRTDRYVFGVFLASLAAGVLFAAGLLLLTDQFQHFDDLIVAAKRLRQKGEPALAGQVLPMAAKYYSYEIAIRFFQFAPFVTFFAAVFTAARLHRSHETVALLASGTSLQRGFLPLFLGGALLAGVQLTFREYVLPRIAGEQNILKTILFEAEPNYTVKDLSIVDAAGNRYSFERYRPARRSGMGFKAIASDGRKFKNVTATEAEFEELPAGGSLLRLVEGREFTLTRDSVAASDSVPVEHLPGEFVLTLRDCEIAARAQGDPEYLSISELDSYASRMRGSLKYQISLHSAFTFALANLILPLLGLPVVLRSERRSTLEGAVMAFALVILYYAVTLLCFQVGAQGYLGTVFAAWLPTVIFGSLGIALFETMRT